MESAIGDREVRKKKGRSFELWRKLCRQGRELRPTCTVDWRLALARNATVWQWGVTRLSAYHLNLWLTLGKSGSETYVAWRWLVLQTPFAKQLRGTLPSNPVGEAPLSAVEGGELRLPQDQTVGSKIEAPCIVPPDPRCIRCYRTYNTLSATRVLTPREMRNAVLPSQMSRADILSVEARTRR